jgi:hypothetical protein
LATEGIHQLLNALGRVVGEAPLFKQDKANLFVNPRRVIDEVTLKELFGTDIEMVDERKTLHVWFLSWTGCRASKAAAPTNTYFRYHTFELIGFRSYSESQREPIVEVADDLQKQLMQYVVIESYDTSNLVFEDLSCDIVNFGEDSLGPIFCATATIQITIQERVQVSSFI